MKIIYNFKKKTYLTHTARTTTFQSLRVHCGWPKMKMWNENRYAFYTDRNQYRPIGQVVCYVKFLFRFDLIDKVDKVLSFAVLLANKNIRN